MSNKRIDWHNLRFSTHPPECQEWIAFCKQTDTELEMLRAEIERLRKLDSTRKCETVLSDGSLCGHNHASHLTGGTYTSWCGGFTEPKHVSTHTSVPDVELAMLRLTRAAWVTREASLDARCSCSGPDEHHDDCALCETAEAYRRALAALAALEAAQTKETT